MGLNFRRRVLINEQVLMKCEKCQKLYSTENCFCRICGTKLKSTKTKFYANLGKNGFTSFSYKLPDGTTINTKGNVTIKLANGISYTITKKKK